MKIFSISFVGICLIVILIETINSSPLKLQVIKENKGIKNIEKLDDAGKVNLSWEVDEVKGSITFEIEAETSGYVGFGISPQGSMLGADIFIAGVASNGTPYASDRHGTGFVTPEVDTHSDWTLLEAKEFNGIRNITYLKFSRLLNTCDEQDYPITNGTNRLIWAMGDTDDITKHSSKGARSISLLAAPIPYLDLSGLLQWDSSLDMAMPEDETAYWCSLHKGPILQKKHHIVAFEAFLPDENALKHTHHFIIYNCYLPADGSLDQVFENYTVDKGQMGDLCYRTEDRLPFMGEECEEYLYVWAKGGKRMVFPENVGYPIGEENDGKQRYYKLEIHYDNPQRLKNIQFRTGVKVYYTDDIREKDAGQLMIGHDVSFAQLIPPNTAEFVTVGHCHPDCTAKFPEGGINVFNVLLHSHKSGRKLKLRQFRNGLELPFLDYDDHYDFDYQQNKQLVSDVKILPGDQLVYECTGDSIWKKGEVVLGGLSTSEEMCQTFLWYWPKQSIDVCGSTYPMNQSLTDLGITDWEEVDAIGQDTYLIKEPKNLEGNFYDSMSKKFIWTPENILELERTRRYEEHDAFCVSRKAPSAFLRKSKYPEGVIPYVPEDICERQQSTSTTMRTSTIYSNSAALKTFLNNFTIAAMVVLTSTLILPNL